MIKLRKKHESIPVKECSHMCSECDEYDPNLGCLRMKLAMMEVRKAEIVGSILDFLVIIGILAVLIFVLF